MAYRKRCNGTCTHVMCDVVGRNRPERNISFICESIALFERCYGADYKDETREMALEAMSKYGPGTPFENDERMLQVYRILGKYSRSMSATDIYDRLYEKNLFKTSAQFYGDWAEAHIGLGNIERSKEILELMEVEIGTKNEPYKRIVEKLRSIKPQPPKPSTVLEHVFAVPLLPTAPRPLIENSQKPSIVGLVSRSSAPAQPARRMLFSRASPPKEEAKLTAAPANYNPTFHSYSSAMLVAPTTEPIVLPTISDLPPVGLDIVSPSIANINAGKPVNFSLPPVFSFSNMNEGEQPRNPYSNPKQHKDKGSAGIACSAVDENMENKNPIKDAPCLPRRVLTGILLPSQGIVTEDYDLDKADKSLANITVNQSSVEKNYSTAFELKKARASGLLPPLPTARRIFKPDPTAQLESALSQLYLN